jgi:uncharacterized protein (DUF2336 family)
LAGPERVAEAYQNGVIAMGASAALIRELYGKVEHISADRRSLTLRHLTDLYLISGDQLSAEEIALIDDTFVRLVETVEVSARALLAVRLGPAAKAPPRVLRLLACDNAIDVASPVLMQAASLDDATLIECATTRSQDHMLAIARRKILSEAVTDVLVELGDRDVVLSAAMNAGARFSASGFGILVKRAEGNDALASYVGKRPDLPPALFERLLEAASETVRAKLTAERPHAAAEIDRAVADATADLRSQAAEQWSPRAVVQSMNQAGRLNAAKLVEFATTGRAELLIAGLAIMAYVPEKVVAEMLRSQQNETLIILARAIGLPWEATRSVIISFARAHPLRPGDLRKLNSAFERLEQATARTILDFRYTTAQGKTVN